MKWINDDFYVSCRKGSDETHLVPAFQANKLCPQLVIAFLQPKLFWGNVATKDDAEGKRTTDEKE